MARKKAQKLRKFIPGIVYIAKTYTVSSLTGKMACDIYKEATKDSPAVGSRFIRFGKWIFLDQDFLIFQASLISYVPEINQLIRWQAAEKELKDFPMSCSGCNAEMDCEWCGRTANKGFDTEKNDTDGPEDVSDTMFAGLQILNCCFVDFFKALLDWKEQAIIWAEEEAAESRTEADRLIELANRGETALAEKAAADEVIAQHNAKIKKDVKPEAVAATKPVTVQPGIPDEDTFHF